MKNVIYSKSDNSGVDSTQILEMGEHNNVGIYRHLEKMSEAPSHRYVNT